MEGPLTFWAETQTLQNNASTNLPPGGYVIISRGLGTHHHHYHRFERRRFSVSSDLKTMTALLLI